jgi:uncharacterized membrane protein
MSFALLAVAAAGLVFIVSFVLPILSFVRMRRAADELRRLSERVDGLEIGLRTLQRTLTVQLAAKPAEGAAERPAAESIARAAAATAPIGPGALSSASPSVATAPAAPATKHADVSAAADTLETRIGGRWLLYIGMATLVLGIGFFVKYAFDNNWINETGRVLIGGLIGLVMVLGGDRIARRSYPLYGQIVAGGGFATLYLSVFAALSFYSLIGRPAAFGLMVLITAGAALAAELHRSQGLAVFAVVGGFLTPFLVGGGENAQVVLLSYDAILAAGTAVMASRRGWPMLNVVSYAFVLLTFVGWAGKFYTPAQYVPTQGFLTIFGAMFTYLGVSARRARSEAADIAGVVLLTAPILFHVASVANLQQQWLPLLVYLTLFSLAGAAASMKLDRAWLRLVVFAAVGVPLAAWIAAHAGPGWRLAPTVVLLAIYVMNLIAIGERISRAPGDWQKADLALLHANALGLFAGLYIILDEFAPGWSPALALGLAVWHGVLARAIRDRSEEAGINSFAMAFAMLGFAIGLQFDYWWAVVGWVIESAAVIWVGLKSRRDWMRLGGALLLTGSLVRLFTLGFFETPAGFDVVFNPRVGATLVIVAVLYALALIHQRGGRQLDDRAAPEIALFVIAANVLTILLISTEISFYWNVRETTDAAADLARMASLSVAWGIYGTALIVVGIVRRYAPIRYLAIALLALTIGKLFLVDLNTLGGIYRIIGFLGLGVFLLLGAWLYQRYRDIIIGREEAGGDGGSSQ